jgi:hypothetical protein
VKVLSKKTIYKKLEDAANKQIDEKSTEIGYNAVVGCMPHIVKQTEATFLYALSLHGYGAKRLNDFHEWFCAICNMPASIMGKENYAINTAEFMRDKYGIDFDKVRVVAPTYEKYFKGIDR